MVKFVLAAILLDLLAVGMVSCGDDDDDDAWGGGSGGSCDNLKQNCPSMCERREACDSSTVMFKCLSDCMDDAVQAADTCGWYDDYSDAAEDFQKRSDCYDYADCDELDACDDGSSSSDGDVDGDVDGDSDADTDDVPSGMGYSCYDHDDCYYYDASYCLTNPLDGDRYCTTTNCSTYYSDCPSGYECCDMGDYTGDVVCVTDDDYSELNWDGYCS